jgi:hypothetical protein
LKSDANGQSLKTGMSLGEWFTYVNFKSDSLHNLQAIQNFVVNKNQITTSIIALRK